MFCYLSFYKKQYLYRLWLILCCSFIRSLCYASAFEQGLDAVKEKDYTQAIERFIQAIDDADMARDKLPLVYYNLGVCYYRMALYDNANSSFKRSMLSNTLMWRSAYSLALVAEKQQRCSYA
ncbi:hypothetical protein JYU12_01220, partial [bacterium AH-315-K03]|nr:hypothetical protein [bacterium AH-315-K03]